MASIEEVRAQIAQAASQLQKAVAAARQASQLADEAVNLVRLSFEGSGRDELLEAASQADAAAISLTDAMIELSQAASKVSDVGNTL